MGLAALLAACGPVVSDPAASGSTSSDPTASETPIGSGSLTAASTESTPSSTGGSTEGLATSSGTDSGTTRGPSLDSTGPSDTTGAPICTPDCGWFTECSDGQDNDGDGLVDTADPECASPCHNHEGSTHHGFPSNDADCFADCFWDDNIGQGDDGCHVSTHCDPLGPEVEISCEPTPDSPMCQQKDPEEPEYCLMACLPMTPPGCDCFGCCTIPTPQGLQDHWMADWDCTLADPSSCAPCTKHEQCAVACDEPCQWCFGQPELPAGCPEATCDPGPPCQDHCDCPEQHGCLQGCCRPLIVGA